MLCIRTCKKEVKLSNLAQNMVPKRVAIHSPSPSSKNRNKSKQEDLAKERKVVVHYLGTQEWGVTSIDDVTPYTSTNALDFVCEWKEEAEMH